METLVLMHTYIFSEDGKFASSFFPGINFHYPGDIYLEIDLITLRTHSCRKNFNWAKITEVIKGFYNVRLEFWHVL